MQKLAIYSLVGALEHDFFFHILRIIIPIDELMFVRGVAQPPTSSWWQGGEHKANRKNWREPPQMLNVEMFEPCSTAAGCAALFKHCADSCWLHQTRLDHGRWAKSAYFIRALLPKCLNNR